MIRSGDSLLTARWYSSWILFTTLIPIFCMYGVWGTLTLTNKLQPSSIPQRDWFNLDSDNDFLYIDDGAEMPITTMKNRSSSKSGVTTLNDAQRIAAVLEEGDPLLK